MKRPLMSLLKTACAFLIAAAPLLAHAQAPAAARPNIVHIFVDDLGYGSVGFNGQKLIQTPNLDALAARGMNFTNAYAAPICGPSRGMLLTGFHNGHARIDRNQDLNGDVFAADDVTVADTLLAAGYRTSAFGKHGFGATGGNNPMGHGQGTSAQVNGPNSVPSGLGYEMFYGYLNHLSAHNYFPATLWESNAVNVDPTETLTGNTPRTPHAAFAHDLVTDRTVDYLRTQARAQNAGNGAPFYSQVNFTIPHANVGDVAFAGRNRYAAKRWTQNQKNYAELVSRMDDSVGAIIRSLRDPNGDGNTSDSVLENTLILFTSDNGPTRQSTDLATLNFFDAAGSFRGTKRDLYEGGVHVPAIAFWQGTIQAGSTSDRYTDLADFLPTAAELAGVHAPVGTDGVSLAPLLTGQGVQRDRDYLVFEHHEPGGEQPNSQRSLWAIIHRNGYKLIRHASGDELFNLNADPGETTPLNLAAAGNQAIYNELLSAALAEGVEADRRDTNAHVVAYRRWTGAADNGRIADAGNWSGSGAPTGTWSAVIDNETAADRVAHVSGRVQTLGIEVRGSGAKQTVHVDKGATLVGRNEIRIAQGGHVVLDGGGLETARWIEVARGAELSGDGRIIGELHAEGRVAPGLLAGPVAVDDVAALAFDFTGVQDDAPLQATAQRSQYLRLTQGLSFGAGTTAHDAAQAGNEFNVRGFNTRSLAQAIAGDDYVGYTIAPIDGIEVQLDTVSFNVWRNGVNAGTDYAVLTSIDGFTADDALTTLTVNNVGVGNQHTIQGASSAGWTANAIDIRLYGWNATANGNTHLNAASLSANFRSIPGAKLMLQGILSLQGNYYQHASAALAIDLAGASNANPDAPEFDQVVVQGLASLGGRLEVELASGYMPDAGDVFLLVDAQTYAGQFDYVMLPELEAGRFWDLSQLSEQGILNVTAELLGDLDADGFVGQSDLELVQANLGQSTLAADVNGDGIVSADDLRIVRANLGLGTDANIPEPSTAAAISLGAILLSTHRRAR